MNIEKAWEIPNNHICRICFSGLSEHRMLSESDNRVVGQVYIVPVQTGNVAVVIENASLNFCCYVECSVQSAM